MKKIHETQKEETFHPSDDEIYSPIEDLQKTTGSGPYKKSSFQLSKLPKGIRYIGYFIIGFCIISGILGYILSLLF